MSDDRLDQLDYYDLLQVEPTSTIDDVRRAFHAFAAKYHPDRFAGAPPEKQERAAQIYRRGAEAYRVLLDPEQRRIYEAQRARGKLRLDPEEKTDRGNGPGTGGLAIRSPRARPFAQKATEAFKKGDWATARLNLKLAMQHEPENALLQARLAEVEQRLRAR
ncbi:J domain-containing protein [Sandaracinus amylolyticus]|uniref:J domain-containing protein n=1 Tax=Sandaracinus amylolyticus TaxID=927083 RepID=UPI0009FA2F0E|nr:DnaJ domain-containing protein [Sandaracinus amylolyticus]